eukprot:GHVU01067716.1.p1 GENE.GHVU01067716.1~~GHVU01067716.1.p1  ORF type:complete len:409 (+),score=76.05 GHVU01067716.1:601-1827(+)
MCISYHSFIHSCIHTLIQLISVLHGAKRVILLSGTPPPNKPMELYTQLDYLMPMFCTFEQFASRYCKQTINTRSGKSEYTDARFTDELHVLVKSTFMIQRLWTDVQKELPSKMRSKIPVECSKQDVKVIAEKLSAMSSLTGLDGTYMDGEDRYEGRSGGGGSSGGNEMVKEVFALTCLAKVNGVCEYVMYLLQSGCKFILLAHHDVMLDVLENLVKEEKIGYVRIDCLTPMGSLGAFVNRFRNEKECRVAILSITACEYGLKLEAAEMVVFAELFWRPGNMIKLEDISHSLESAHSTVNIHYIFAEGTLDNTVWLTLQKKWREKIDTLDVKREEKSAEMNSKECSGSSTSLPPPVSLVAGDEGRGRGDIEEGRSATPSSSSRTKRKQARTVSDYVDSKGGRGYAKRDE